MARTLAARIAASTLAGVVAMTGLMAPARAEPPVSLERAGSLVGWGIAIAPGDAYTLPQGLSDTAFNKVIAGAGFSVALTANGKMVVLGRGYAPGISMEQIPASVAAATVVDVAVGGFSAAAVTSAGKVEVWGSHSDLPDAADVPAGLADVKSVAVGQSSAAAVKADGTVVAWGGDRFGETVVPAGLTDVVSLSAGDTHYYALKADGTVAAWGSDNHGETTLPAELTLPGNVKAVVARSAGGLALLTDGSLVSWGLSAGTPNVLNGVPESLDGQHVVAISALSNNNMALEQDGEITVWGLGIEHGAGLGMEQLKQIPAKLAGVEIAGIAMGDEHAMALVTDVLTVRKPTIAGMPRAGKVLTGTPAGFSGAPTAVANQWFADGRPLPGETGTTLHLTDDLAGKRITFASTAAKAGEDETVSISDQTDVVEVEFAPSTVSVSAAPTTYGTRAKVVVSVTNSLGRPVTGTVQLSGAGPAQLAAVSGGMATFTLGRALSAGRYIVTASYSGDAGIAKAWASSGFKVGKARSKSPSFEVIRMSTSKRNGRAKVAVANNKGLAHVTGKVTVRLKRGRSIRVIQAKLPVGARPIILPKLRKGTWRARISYSGDVNYSSSSSNWSKLRIKR